MDRKQILIEYHTLSKILDHQQPPVLNIKSVRVNFIANTVIGYGESIHDQVEEVVAPGEVMVATFD